ncbi:L-dopachrome tautomerase-related protein [Synechococcus sp. PCC 7335]|uniref:L-dopachrome tautomerase-related protein n=1 Tax=Synechococcus sp. (strain ATCC 29403 / PCC 7335) TaxID=91464 RepID=UPI00056E264D|nr:L-dopachrome tautomerase-related protein [Synechococcus sp. PCC 7335]
MISPIATEHLAGELETVATFSGPMPAGVTVSDNGRIFVTFPRWGDEVPFTVGEVVDGEAIAYPSSEINEPEGAAAESLVSVQSVVVAPNNWLWALDAARIEFGEPPENGPKLVAIDLATNEVVKTILLPTDVAMPTSYLNDVRFDLQRGESGIAYITDSSTVGDNGLIVVDLASGNSWRRLHQHSSTLPEPNFTPIVESEALLNRSAAGETSHMTIGADGIAISADGSRLFYRVLSGRHLYSIDANLLSDPAATDEDIIATIEDHGDLGFASDGLEANTADQLYLTNYEDNSIMLRQPDGSLETLVHNPSALWPDTLSLASNGYLYFISNQLHRQPGFNYGEDMRQKPYALYRVRTDAEPVRLR